MRSSRFAIIALAFAVLSGLVAGLLLAPGSVRAQDAGRPVQIGASAPLPVFVTNTPALPDGFVPGSRWRFTTWSAPSVITWVGSVRQVSGPWAYIEVTLESRTTAGWYYVPAMPGAWDRQ